MPSDFVCKELAPGWWYIDVNGVLPSGMQFRRRRRIKATSKRMANEFAKKIWSNAVDDNVQNKRSVPKTKDFCERWIEEHAIANKQKPSGIEHKRIMLRCHILPVVGEKNYAKLMNETSLKLNCRCQNMLQNQ